MSRYLHGFLILLLVAAMFGCDGGATSGDPLGTDSIKIEASIQFLGAGEDSIITVTVERLNKLPATDRLVSFQIVTNNSGGTFRVVNEKVDGQGKAVAVYTTGTRDPENYVEDTIRASLSNGASAAVTIARAGWTRSYIAELRAEPSVVLAVIGSSVITATVKTTTIDKTTGLLKDYPVSGATVIFSIPTRNTGWPSLSTVSGISDGNGIVTTVYTPGTAWPNVDLVSEAVQASLADGSSRSVVITRRSQTIPAGAVVTLEADPTSVNAGQTSIIKATVTGGTGAGANEAVTLTIPVNNSGASFINAAGDNVSTVTIRTGAGGIASAIYRAGTNAAGTSVQDTVQGVLTNGALNAVTITRSAGVTGYVVTVTATPSTLSAATGSSVVTANVKDNTGVAAGGQPVTFTVTGDGTISLLAATTDASGNATTIFTGDGTSPGSGIVQASVTIGGNTYNGAVTITLP